VGRRAAQVGSVLVLGTTTVLLAWSETPERPSLADPGGPAAVSAATARTPDVTDATDPTDRSGRPDPSAATGPAVTTGRGGSERPAALTPPVPPPPSALTPPAEAGSRDTLATPSKPSTPLAPGASDGAAEIVGTRAAPDEQATDAPTGAEASPASSSPAGGPLVGGPLAGRSLTEVLGPAGPPGGPGSPRARSTPPAPLRPPAPSGLDLTQRSTQDPASTWVVVKKALPLVPADYAPTGLVTVQGYQVRAEVQEPLTALLAAAASDGVQLGLRSAFRSAAYQEAVHGSWSRLVGDARADEVSARAGHSEHQTGLAVDIGSTTRPGCDFEECFDTTAEGAWVAAHAGGFGFLVRYTAANQDVTGFAPEGWHLRYVGTDLVAELERRGVTTLEELFGLPGGPDYA
jgi:D-alanyl-D-alanine carboxypeptidase